MAIIGAKTIEVGLGSRLVQTIYGIQESNMNMASKLLLRQRKDHPVGANPIWKTAE